MSGLSLNQAMWSMNPNGLPTPSGYTRGGVRRDWAGGGLGGGWGPSVVKAWNKQQADAATALDTINKVLTVLNSEYSKMRQQGFEIEQSAGTDDFATMDAAKEVQTQIRSVAEIVADAESIAGRARSAWAPVANLKTRTGGDTGGINKTDIEPRKGPLAELQTAANTLSTYPRKLGSIQDSVKFSILRLNKVRDAARAKAAEDAKKAAEAMRVEQARAQEIAAQEAERERVRLQLEASRAAEAQAAAAAVERERDAALAIEQQRAAVQAAAAQRESEAASRKMELELRRLEMEMQIEQRKLEFDLARLEREEERAVAAEERAAQREAMEYQLQLAERGLAPPPAAPAGYQYVQAGPPGYEQQSSPGIWQPTPGAQEFAYSSAAPQQYAPLQQAGPRYAQPAQQQYQQPGPPPVIRPVPSPQATGPVASGPVPVAYSSAPQQTGIPGFSFESDWAVPTGQLFGMGGLVGVRNSNLPSDARVEDGYKIYGPDSEGRFKVVRPDGSTFFMSHAQCCSPNVSVNDSKTGKVFYNSGSGKSAAQTKATTTAEDIQAGTEVASSIVTAASDAFNRAFSAYGKVTGKEQQQQKIPTTVVGSGMPGWVAPVALVALGAGVLAYMKRKK